MGITIVHKSGKGPARKGAGKALILAGGAITGASFMAGGLKALNDYLDGFSVADFDMYVGISAGSLLAAPLAGGIPPEEILKSLDGTSKKFTKFSAWHYYFPNFLEFLTRPASFAKKLFKDGDASQIHELLPSGIFDNGPIEHYIRKNIENNGLTNSFRSTLKATGKRLYVVACALDDAKREVFGPDEKSDVEISKAIQASTALPGFYKPVRIDGVDYIDGGVQETAAIDLAIGKGAELIVCYNPFRPHTREGRLAGEGIMAVLSQIFRTFFHDRLHVTIEKFRNDPNFKGDIMLVEPKDDDKAFFDLNPLMFSNRIRAACLGFESVMGSIEEHYGNVRDIFARYEIKMTKKRVARESGFLKNAGGDAEKLRKILE